MPGIVNYVLGFFNAAINFGQERLLTKLEIFESKLGDFKFDYVETRKRIVFNLHWLTPNVSSRVS